jgi:Permease family
LAGFGGGSATTTYAENIGVMAATRVYSTAAYWIAAAVAVALSLCPKVGATISAIPPQPSCRNRGPRPWSLGCIPVPLVPRRDTVDTLN